MRLTLRTSRNPQGMWVRYDAPRQSSIALSKWNGIGVVSGAEFVASLRREAYSPGVKCRTVKRDMIHIIAPTEDFRRRPHGRRVRYNPDKLRSASPAVNRPRDLNHVALSRRPHSGQRGRRGPVGAGEARRS
jgi:hypothetical protein